MRLLRLKESLKLQLHPTHGPPRKLSPAGPEIVVDSASHFSAIEESSFQPNHHHLTLHPPPHPHPTLSVTDRTARSLQHIDFVFSVAGNRRDHSAHALRALTALVCETTPSDAISRTPSLVPRAGHTPLSSLRLTRRSLSASARYRRLS